MAPGAKGNGPSYMQDLFAQYSFEDWFVSFNIKYDEGESEVMIGAVDHDAYVG